MNSIKMKMQMLLLGLAGVVGVSVLNMACENMLAAQAMFRHPAFEIIATCYQMCRLELLI